MILNLFINHQIFGQLYK